MENELENQEEVQVKEDTEQQTEINQEVTPVVEPVENPEEIPVVEVGSAEWIKEQVSNGIKEALENGKYVSQDKFDKILSKRLSREKKKLKRAEPPKKPDFQDKSIADFDGNIEQFNKHLVDRQFEQRDYIQQKTQYDKSIADEEYQAASKQWFSGLDKARVKYPDIDTKLKEAELNKLFSDEASTDLINSENNGEIAYFLANNLQEAEKYSRLNDRQRLMYLARMSIKVEENTTNNMSVANMSQQTPITKAVSSAPAPTGANTPNPNGGSQVNLSKISQEDYSALRKKQRANRSY